MVLAVMGRAWDCTAQM
jgi:hypothetical protein